MGGRRLPILMRAVGIQETLSKKFAHLRNYLMSRRLKELARPSSRPSLCKSNKKTASLFVGRAKRSSVLLWHVASRTNAIYYHSSTIFFSHSLRFSPLLFPSFPSSFFLFPFFFAFQALKTDEFSTDSRQIGGKWNRWQLKVESLAVKRVSFMIYARLASPMQFPMDALVTFVVSRICISNIVPIEWCNTSLSTLYNVLVLYTSSS